MRALTLLALGLVAAWSVLYRRGLESGDVVRVTVVDAVMLTALAAATPVIVPDEWLTGGHSWLRPFTTFAAVGYQYTAPPRVAVPVGGLLCVAVAIATNRATPGEPGLDGVITAGWSVVTMLLARLLWNLLGRAGRRADATLEAADKAERRRMLDEGVRADEQVVMASLHDTALATLNAVSMGQVDDLDQVRRLAGRDLATLRGLTQARPGPALADLRLQVLAVVELADTAVDFDGPQQPLEVPSAVAHAFTGALTEALGNVRRHSGVQSARVRLITEGNSVQIEVRDAGAGFDAKFELVGLPGIHRGLRHSIQQRMLSVGGRAVVASQPGRGTQVVLGWSDD
jgi:signal transduction histidine kinase